MIYEYPLLDDYKSVKEFMDNFPESVISTLKEAAMHDPILMSAYRFYANYSTVDPFESENFFIYLSYVALASHSTAQKRLIEHIQRTINPPIMLIPKQFKFSPGAINAEAHAAHIRHETWLIRLLKWWRGRK